MSVIIPSLQQIKHNVVTVAFSASDSKDVNIKIPFYVKRMKVSCGYSFNTDTKFSFYNITMDDLNGDVIASCGNPAYTDGAAFYTSSDIDYSKGIWFEFPTPVQMNGLFKINLVPIDSIALTKTVARVVLDFECYSW